MLCKNEVSSTFKGLGSDQGVEAVDALDYVHFLINAGDDNAYADRVVIFLAIRVIELPQACRLNVQHTDQAHALITIPLQNII